jgi:hypothetical protein
MTKLHAAVAVLVALLLPAYSWLGGSGSLAWTMFSRSQTFRLSVRVADKTGRTRIVNPSELAKFADAETASYLLGSEHFRQSPVGSAFVGSLQGLAGLGCRTVPEPASVSVTLEIRKTLDDEPAPYAATVNCS